MRQVFLPVFATAWAAYLERTRITVPPGVTDFAARFAELAPVALETLSRRPTLLHGDIRADNLIVIRKGEIKPGMNEFGSISIVVPNGRAMAERAVAAGYQTARPIVDGTNFIRDPDGYIIELYQRPAAKP